MKSVLQITTPDEIGLLEKASEFIFIHNGSIVSDTVRVFGDKAFLILHFEAEPGDMERMRAALADYPPFAGFGRVELIETNESSEPQPEPTGLVVWCRDMKGLLAQQTELVREYQYTILSHDGNRTLAGDEVNHEYMQTFSLSISHERLDQEDVVVNGRKVRRWERFKDQLQQMLAPRDGRFTIR